MSLTLLASVLIGIILINLIALITSRKGSTIVHRTAFWAGVVGLVTSLLAVATAPMVAVSGLAGAKMEGFAIIVVSAATIAALAAVTSAGSIVGMLVLRK